MKTALIAIGDPHVNSTVGLHAPDVIGDDGAPIGMSKSQEWLWECWLDFCDKIKGTWADRKILLLNGDIGEVDSKGRSSQLHTTNDSTTLSLMKATFKPAIDEVDEVLVIRGTEAHASLSGSIEESYADTLGNKVIRSSTGMASWYAARVEIEGVRFDIAHHTVAGGHLPWTEKAAALKVAAMTIAYYQDELELPLPNVILRSHLHRSSDTGDNYIHKGLRAYVLPAWQLKTSYVFGIGKENTVSHIGGYIFLCENGEYIARKVSYKPRAVGWKQI